MPAFENDFALVGGADPRDQMFRRLIRHDVIVFGNRMQDRHPDLVELRRAAAGMEKVLGGGHGWTQWAAGRLADALDERGKGDEAAELVVSTYWTAPF